MANSVQDTLKHIQSITVQMTWFMKIAGAIIVVAGSLFVAHIVKSENNVTEAEFKKRKAEIEYNFLSKKDYYLMMVLHTNAMEEMQVQTLEAVCPNNLKVINKVKEISDRNKALIEILTDSNYKGIYSGHDTYDRVIGRIESIQVKKEQDSLTLQQEIEDE